MRSLLMVNAGSDARLDGALAAGAHAIVVNLADGNAGDLARRRRRTADFIAANREGAAPFVRVHPLTSDLLVGDLDAVVASRPSGIVLPEAAGSAAVERLSAMLRPREAAAGLEDGAIAIIAICADTAAGLLSVGTYAGATARLVGLAWDADRLGASMGMRPGPEAAPRLGEASCLARTLTLAAAAAAAVTAIDTPFADTSDLASLEEEARQAHADGFAGKFALTPEQVAVVNRVFYQATRRGWPLGRI